LSGNLGGIGHFLLGAVQTLALFIIGPVIAFYLLVDLPRLQRTALRLIPPQRRDEVVEVAASVGGTMGNFFRGQLLVALIVGIMSSIAMRIIGLPYWLVVGMIAGVFNLVPLIGPFIGAVPGILIAGALRTPWHMLWVALGMLVVQQIDNHFISPNVMRFTVRLHPVTVMVTLIAGATLAGFWGMLLAVPGLASIKLVVAHLWRTRVPWGYEVFEVPPLKAAVPPGEPPQEVREARTLELQDDVEKVAPSGPADDAAS
jgi:predicted PurR-regulated permease PerM